MPTSFVSHALLLKNLFNSRFLYTIPIYQRPFSWTDKESTRLFEDIIDAMGPEAGTFQLDSFFLGALILTGNMEEVAKNPLSGKLVAAFNAIVSGEVSLPANIKGNFDVVDGKQRLITLQILLCLLRDLSSNGEKSDLEEMIGDGQNDNRYRLNMNGGEEQFMHKHILPPGSSLHPVTNLENRSDGEKKLILVRKYLLENLQNLSDPDRIRLLDYLRHHCEVVIILSEKIDHAFQIFMSINDTGAKLTGGDILKAELMSKLDPKDVEKYSDTWEQWNDSLGDERGKAGSRKKTFFNHFRYVLTSNPLNILTDFRSMVDQAGGAEPFINDYLIPNIKAYDVIHAGDWPHAKHKADMNLILGALNWLPHDDWIAPAMLAITKFANDPDKTLMFFQKLERLAYGLLIMPGGAADRKKKYNPLKRSLRGPESGRDPFKDVEFLPSEKKHIRKIIEHGLHKSRPAAARLLLLRLDMEQFGKPVSYYDALIKDELFSVEHLLPLSPEANSEWVKHFPDEKLRLFNTELFGNLFLVRKNSENPLMKNFDFPQKHQILFGNNRDHPLLLTNGLKNQKDWTLSDIAQRQDRLLSIIDKIWPQ